MTGNGNEVWSGLLRCTECGWYVHRGINEAKVVCNYCGKETSVNPEFFAAIGRAAMINSELWLAMRENSDQAGDYLAEVIDLLVKPGMMPPSRPAPRPPRRPASLRRW
jgi:hypothetical protein